MGRRALAGRDTKIIQGQRRDAFFARMRRKGGVPRMPNQAPALVEEEEAGAGPSEGVADVEATAAAEPESAAESEAATEGSAAEAESEEAEVRE